MFRKLNLKNRYLVLIMVAALAASVLLVFLYYKEYINQPVFLIFMFISIFTFTSASSAIMNKSIANRLARKKHGDKFNYNIDSINKDNFDNYEKLNYGDSYTKTINKAMYNLNVIYDSGLFFSEEADKQNIKLKNISKSIQFYIFMDDEFKMDPKRMQILNYQAKKFFLQSFVYDSKKQTLTQVEKVDVAVDFVDNVHKMYDLLNIDLNNLNK